MDSLSDSSTKAGSSVKGTSDNLDDLGDSSSKASSNLKGTEGSMDGISDSSSDASSSVKGASDSLDSLGDSGTKASGDLKGADSAIDGVSDSSSNATSSVKGASDSLDSLGDSGTKTAGNLKGTDGAIDGVADSSAQASSDVKGASDSLDNLGDSGSRTSKDLKGADSAIDSVSDSSADASSTVKSASDSLDNLGDSGSRASKDLQGADSAIDSVADSSSDASSSVKGISDNLDNMSDSASGAAKGAQNVKNETEEMGDKTTKASIGLKDLAVSLGLVAIASAAFHTLKESMDDAISRFDTLNTFPKVLEALGVSAEDAERSMTNLSDGIDGLPTTLDDIAGSAQEMYSSFNDMDKATDTALALNNALMGSGASAAQAQRGVQQYTKALQTDQMYLSTWNTLSETMGVGLAKVAEEFKMTGASAKNDLYQALQDGTITMDEFNDKLIEVGTGTGIMAKLAKENSLGIATSLGNLKNAAARGIADIIDSFNRLSVAVTGNDIAENIDALKRIVNASFQAIGSVIEGTAPIVIAFSSAIQATLPVVNALTPALVGLATAYAIHKVISLATTAITANATVVAIATTAKNAYAIATNRLALSMTLALVQMKIQSAALLAYNKIVAIAITTQAMLTSGMSLASIATVALSGAVHILNVAIKVLLGPIGWVTLAIGALVGIVVGIIKMFNKTSEEAERLNGETEKLSDSTDELTDSLNGTSEAYKDNAKDIEATANKNSELAEQIDELSAKENKSAADKALLASHIESLNGSIDGLNLAYDEEADALSMSSEELQARLDLMKETEAGMAAQERLTEIIEEQNQAQMQLDEINDLREEWNEKLKESTVNAGEHENAVADLDEQETELKETIALLGEQYGITEEQIIAAAENATTAVEEGNLRQITSYEELSDEHKVAFDSMKETYDELVDNATNAFDRMNEESKVSGKEMIDNLEHNQEMTAQWGENHATLMERAGEEGNDGFIQWLETMGPDSAAELAEVTNMSDEELDRFIELMNEAPEVASDSFKSKLGEGLEESVDVMVKFVDDGSKSMRDQIKSSGFDEIGSMIPEGLVEGIDSGSTNVQNASENMADDTTDAAKNALGINSPSRVFKEMGAAPIGISSNETKKNSEVGAHIMSKMRFKEVVIVG